MRKQTGCIYVNGDNWCLRWREGDNGTRKQRFKDPGAVGLPSSGTQERHTSKEKQITCGTLAAWWPANIRCRAA
jgi:hypothetical protein